MRVLAIGDVVGRGGRETVARLLPEIRAKYEIDLVCLQGENAAGGFGLTEKVTKELLGCGVDVITSGNHIWDKRDFMPVLASGRYPVVRPINYPEGAPGPGFVELERLTVVNAMGLTWMPQTVDSPFPVLDRLLERLDPDKPILVDFHAETTSEKRALGWFLDGRVAGLVGTHTHVPTADAQILPKGTAFVTDLGMVGSSRSVLGMEPDTVLERMQTAIPHRMRPVEKGPMQFNSVMIEMENRGQRAVNVCRVDQECQI